jgi:hypothetical protein
MKKSGMSALASVVVMAASIAMINAGQRVVAAGPTDLGILIDAQVAGDLDQFLSSRASTDFGGVVVDEVARTVTVWAAPGGSIDAATRQLISIIQSVSDFEVTANIREVGLAADLRVMLLRDPHTYDRMARLSSKLVAAHSEIVEFYTDYSNHTLHVGVDRAADLGAHSRIKSTAGAEPIALFDAERGEKDTRSNDGRPHYAGSRIVKSTGALCTSDFRILRAGSYGMLTAGHCGGVAPGTGIGSTWKNGTGTSLFGTMNGWNNGNCSNPSLAACHDDAYLGSLASPNYAANMYDDGPSGGFSRYVSGSKTPTAFVDGIYISGATTGTTGPYVLDTSSPICRSLGGQWNCGLMELFSNVVPSGSGASGGDSGGALFTYTAGSDVKAVGIHIGTDGGGHWYYTPLSTALLDFGASLGT